MENINWVPKGSDGAHAVYTAKLPTREHYQRGMRAFKDMCAAVDRDDMATVDATWHRFCDDVNGQVDPYALTVQVGVVLCSIVVRATCGDPDPTHKPTGIVDIAGITWNESTGEVVDSPVSDVAIAAITLAANHNWDDLTALMRAKLIEHADNSTFLPELASCLMSIFIGVGGVETIGLRE